jgi:hypothetical protein
MYSARGRNTGTGGTINHAVFGLWNPSADQVIKLLSVMAIVITNPSANNWFSTFHRTTGRGTPNNTVTPNISNHSKRGIPPPSGVLLDLGAFSAQPTLESEEWGPCFCIGANQDESGVVNHYRFHGGLYIPPGTGIALTQTVAVGSPTFEVTVNWAEDY